MAAKFKYRIDHYLDNVSVGPWKVGVPAVGHRPVEVSVHLLDVHVQVLCRLHDVVYVPNKETLSESEVFAYFLY